MISKTIPLQQGSDPAQSPAENSELDKFESDPDRYLLERWLRLAEAAMKRKAK